MSTRRRRSAKARRSGTWRRCARTPCSASDCVVGRGAYIGSGVRRRATTARSRTTRWSTSPPTLADGVFIGPAVVLTNDTYPRAVTPDGDAEVGRRLGGGRRHASHEGASIGARAVCVAPVTIGRWAMVAAGSVVTKDVPDFALVAGSPARQHRLGGQGGRRRLEQSARGTWRLPGDRRAATSRTTEHSTPLIESCTSERVHPPAQAAHRRRGARGRRPRPAQRHARPGPRGRGLRAGVHRALRSRPGLRGRQLRHLRPAPRPAVGRRRAG